MNLGFQITMLGGGGYMSLGLWRGVCPSLVVLSHDFSIAQKLGTQNYMFVEHVLILSIGLAGDSLGRLRPDGSQMLHGSCTDSAGRT